MSSVDNGRPFGHAEVPPRGADSWRDCGAGPDRPSLGLVTNSVPGQNVDNSSVRDRSSTPAGRSTRDGGKAVGSGEAFNEPTALIPSVSGNNLTEPVLVMIRLKAGVAGETARVCHVIDLSAIVPGQERLRTLCDLEVNAGFVEQVDFSRSGAMPCNACANRARARRKIGKSTRSVTVALDLPADSWEANLGRYLTMLHRRLPEVFSELQKGQLHGPRLENFADVLQVAVDFCREHAQKPPTARANPTTSQSSPHSSSVDDGLDWT
jgi:hypothetical protein